jgi:DNA-binding MarR family transcriptional regulator
MADYVTERRGAALGARLRRLCAIIDADAARVYADSGIRFEQRWFGVVNQLSLNGAMGVGALADALGISHPSVSEVRKSLEKAGLVRSATDQADSRRRVLTLTAAGDALVARLRPMWQVFDDVAEQLDAEAGGVTEVLTQLDRALARKPLHTRIAERLGSDGAEGAHSSPPTAE